MGARVDPMYAYFMNYVACVCACFIVNACTVYYSRVCACIMCVFGDACVYLCTRRLGQAVYCHHVWLNS